MTNRKYICPACKSPMHRDAVRDGPNGLQYSYVCDVCEARLWVHGGMLRCPDARDGICGVKQCPHYEAHSDHGVTCKNVPDPSKMCGRPLRCETLAGKTRDGMAKELGREVRGDD